MEREPPKPEASILPLLNKDQFETLLKEEITFIRALPELRNARAQLYARGLGARINTRVNEDRLWSWTTRLISNGSMLVVSEHNQNSIHIAGAFKDAAFLLELLSNTAETIDRPFARILAAISYDLAGYQANAVCLMRDFPEYRLDDVLHDNESPETQPHNINFLIPFVRLFLEKKIQAALDLKFEDQDLFLKQTIVATRKWATHIIRGESNGYLESLKIVYSNSFLQSDYLINLFISLILTRARLYEKRSLWKVLSDAGKDTSGIWGKYIRLKTMDLYRNNRIKPITARQSCFEFWASQLAALEAGIVSSQASFVVQMPTSAGKTLIGELVTLNALTSTIGAKCLYIAPFRALANQVEADLRDSFSSLGFSVSTLSGSFELDVFDDFIISETDVLVSTPEKVDILTRLRPDYFSNLSAIIVDEGHLLGEVERGPQLELLLTRLRRRFPDLKVVLISAVMPEQNGKQMSAWLSGSESNLIQAPKLEDGKPWQPTQKVFGFFSWDGNTGEITYPEVIVSSGSSGREDVAFARGLADRKVITYFTPTTKAKKTRFFPRELSDKGETAAVVGYEFAKKGPTLVFTTRPDWVLSTAAKLFTSC